MLLVSVQVGLGFELHSGSLSTSVGTRPASESHSPKNVGVTGIMYHAMRPNCLTSTYVPWVHPHTEALCG